MLHFLDITVDTTKRCIYKGGDKVQSSSLNFDLLVYLLENPNEVISKDTLKENVWSGRIISDNTLYKQVKRLKEELLTKLSDEELLQTIHGRGIIFVAKVKKTIAQTEQSVEHTKSRSTKSALYLKLSAALLLLVIAIAFLQINSIKKKNVKLAQKVERMAIVYPADSNQDSIISQRVMAQALKSQLLISDRLNVKLEKGASTGETFKQTSTTMVHDLGYDYVLNIQVITHEYGSKAHVLLRQGDYMVPLKVFEVISMRELIHKISVWVFEQLQTGASTTIDIADMTRSEGAFNDYLRAIRLELENKPDLAIAALQQAVVRDPLFFQAWNQLAGQHIKRGQFEKALEIIENIDLSRASDRLSFQVLSMKAGGLFYLGNLSQASSAFDEALTYSERLHDPTIQVMALVNQAYIYSAMFLPDKARKNLEEALLYVDKNYQKSTLANIYTGLYEIHNNSSDVDSALYYSELAYEAAKLSGNKRSVNIALVNRANALLMYARFEDAYIAAQKVVATSDAEVMVSLYALKLLIQIDLEYGNFEIARQKLDSFNNKLKLLEDPYLKAEYLSFEYQYHMNTGNPARAEEFLQQSGVLSLEVESIDVNINYAILQAAHKLRTTQDSISVEQLSSFDESIPNGPHLYVKAQIFAHNKQAIMAEELFEESMLAYQQQSLNYTLIKAINAYLSFMLNQNSTSESVSNWLTVLDSLAPPPYPYLKNKALYQSLKGDSKNAYSTMLKLKSSAKQWWLPEDDFLLSQYASLAGIIITD
ncbi:MAG: winged helix-turn-helix domain-containing protein [Xanthomonadales bacterium]|nr:winged helix-turn-helix domain-containing protein [Xanthomonadales bacterium]